MGSGIVLCQETGKRGFEDNYHALHYAERVAIKLKEDVGNLNVYQCEHCQLLHVGHNHRSLKPKSLRAIVRVEFDSMVKKAVELPPEEAVPLPEVKPEPVSTKPKKRKASNVGTITTDAKRVFVEPRTRDEALSRKTSLRDSVESTEELLALAKKRNDQRQITLAKQKKIEITSELRDLNRWLEKSQPLEISPKFALHILSVHIGLLMDVWHAARDIARSKSVSEFKKRRQRLRQSLKEFELSKKNEES
jgi:hypothetical protein